MRNNYLIPANSKKSQLILNAFRMVDLLIMGAGALITLALMFIIPGDGLVELTIKLLPLGIGLLLVVPIPFYHNVLVFLREVYIYFSSQKTYVWRGWCAKYGFEDDDNSKKN